MRTATRVNLILVNQYMCFKTNDTKCGVLIFALFLYFYDLPCKLQLCLCMQGDEIKNYHCYEYKL